MIDLIKAATLSNDPQQQKQAQATIIQIRHEQTQNFFVENAKILHSQDLPTNLRHAAGTLLTVSLKTKSNQVFLWDKVAPPNKSAFKDMVLNTMIDREKLIRRAAANIVAAICCIQIPRNEWPGIAQKITANMSNEDLVVKEVSILTIGFICEQLKEFNFDFQEKMQETILTGILMGIKDNHNEIAETAFKALRDGIPAVSDIMKNNQYRDYLINQIAQAIRSQRMVAEGLQCFIQFVKFNYGFITPNYAEGFANIINPFLTNSKEENTCILAMEFWSTFAKEEKNIESNPGMNKFITGALGQKLIQGLLQNLCVVEEDDEEGNGVSESAASALEAIFEGDSSEYQAKVLTFTENTIKHENWKYRQGSIRAFATLLMGLSPQVSQNLVNLSLLELVALLNDPKLFVQYSALKSLSYICEDVGEVILGHTNFIQILQLIIKKGQINENFMRYVCKVIDSLCQVPESTASFQPISDELIKVFFSYLEANRTESIINSCFNTIINLIKCSQSSQLAHNYIDYILARIERLQGFEKEKRQMFYSGFFTIIQISLMTIRKSGGSINVELLSTLYDLVVNHFSRINNLNSDGFYIVAALAYFLPNDRRLVDNFWRYIEEGLKRTNQDQIFKGAISCICDFSSIYRERIVDKVDSTITQLLDAFQKNIITRQMKLEVLMCIGQIFLQCGQACLNHLKRVMDVMLLSCQGVIQLKDQNYAETLMCIFHGLNNERPCLPLAEYIKNIVPFIVFTTDKSRHPKLDYVKDTMILLADIASFYPAEMRGISKQDFLNDRMHILNKYNKDGHLTSSINYIAGQLNS